MCNMKFSSPVVAESHYQGKVHAKNLRLKSTGPQTPCVYNQCALTSILSSFLFLFLSLLVSSSLSDTSTSTGPEETSGGSQQRAGRRRWRQRRQQRLQPFLLHVPGIVQQPAHGPAALRRQEAQKADDKDKADGDVRTGHGSRSGHTAEITSPQFHVLILSCCLPASTLKGYPCTICKIELNSVEQYQSHISGAKHNNQ